MIPRVLTQKTTPVGAPTPARGLNHLLDYTERGLAMKATRVCSVHGCERPTRTGTADYCNPHYKRWLRTGSTGSVEIAPPPGSVRGAVHHAFRGDAVTYNGAHRRVKDTRGPASAHNCAECSAPAEHWAYDHEDPNELWGTTNRGRRAPFSGDPNRYRPMCRSCHARFDAAPRGVSV